MRKLQCNDLFLLSEIVDLMDISIDYPSNLTDEGAQQRVGMDIMLKMAKSIYKAQPQIMQLLANINEKTVDEIKATPANEVLTMFKSILSSEDFTSFFK